MWDKNDETSKPSLETVKGFVKSPLFDQMCGHLEEEYQSKPVIEYSKCSGQPGWNVKYKKAGRTLCTLYPMEGYFITLIVIGEREREQFEFMQPYFTEYVNQLYNGTRTCMNQKWLMIEVTDDAILEDIKRCVSIRRGAKKK